jgi:hypothetical protein
VPKSEPIWSGKCVATASGDRCRSDAGSFCDARTDCPASRSGPNQTRNYFQQPTQRQNFGQGNAYFQQQPRQQRNFVNKFQGQGGNNFVGQQPRNSQPQAPTVFKKKTNNN